MPFEITGDPTLQSWVDYITLNSKRYKVVDNGGYQPVFDRQKVDDVGLTGLTIIQDFTVSDREPHLWKMTFRVFIAERPSSEWGIWSDFLTAYRALSTQMVFFDTVSTFDVLIRSPIVPVPRVGANIAGICEGQFFVEANLVEVYSPS
jgi:hypothetical protein